MDISVAIGRNVGDSPMSDTDWRAFRTLVYVAVTLGDRQGTVTVEENGRSTYRDDSGEEIEEDMYRIVGTIPTVRAYLALRDRLAKIAAAYQQWGIALSLLQTDMVAPSDTPASPPPGGTRPEHADLCR